MEFCRYKNSYGSNVGTKQLSPTSGDWLKIMSYYMAIKKNEEALYALTWQNTQNILSETSKLEQYA